jgi:hypothetical protein
MSIVASNSILVSVGLTGRRRFPTRTNGSCFRSEYVRVVGGRKAHEPRQHANLWRHRLRLLPWSRRLRREAHLPNIPGCCSARGGQSSMPALRTTSPPFARASSGSSNAWYVGSRPRSARHCRGLPRGSGRPCGVIEGKLDNRTRTCV